MSSAQGADGPRGRVGERGDEGFEVSQIHRYFILMIFRMSSPYNIIKLYFVTGTNRNVWIRRIEGSFNYYFLLTFANVNFFNVIRESQLWNGFNSDADIFMSRT